MKKPSALAHLKTRSHRECEEEYARRQAKAAELQSQFEAQNRCTLANSVLLSAVDFNTTPVQAARVALGGAEERIWSQYDYNPSGYHFDAGENSNETSLRTEKNMESQLNDFDLWESHVVAEQLGFTHGETRDPLNQECEQEEDMLEELLRDVGKLFLVPIFTDIAIKGLLLFVDLEYSCEIEDDEDQEGTDQRWYPYSSKTVCFNQFYTTISRQKLIYYFQRCFSSMQYKICLAFAFQTLSCAYSSGL